ncbi:MULTISPECIES: mechanosensitive ion channel family protein [Hyphomonas]|uniref:mechanosensitive ion channel family protein n=1 Tax=Hyphomonas TaxID=85 RepID=UPI000C3FE6B7|nr:MULTISPECIES: mechanosensitive ion channel domain-containing protein [Hyphomonas]MBB39254.1 mechanosensitive ion channel protein MscS [Hyphomonas sp.]|tara:strand:+ start:1661 stop:3052 length:1392 start_codon:yes stop_codon:yes gene_type:complete
MEETSPSLLNTLKFEDVLRSVKEDVAHLAAEFLSYESLWQFLAIILAGIVGFFLSRVPVTRLKKLAASRERSDVLFHAAVSSARIVWPVVTALLLWITIPVFGQFGLRNEILRVAASLLNAWIIVRLITSNIRDGLVANTLTLLAWLIAALYILRLLQPVTESLDSTIIELGGVKFSILRLLTSLAVAAFALWLGRIAGDAAQAQLRSSKKLTPSMAGLLGQVLKIAFIIIAILIALQVVGVNLTALTILSGTLGIGIGFGLQAIFSNFVSGLIILIEKSVKVGDFIELQSGVTGLVREINIRSTLVTTNDNVDILVPNEEFIKAQVINWTLREARRRVRVPFGVAYGSDKELVRKAGLEAAEEVEWTLKGMPGRTPQVWLTKFGDSALEFELVAWLTDAAVSRPARVIADYNWAIHTALEKYELEIPFPQRDLHLKSATGLNVTVETRSDKSNKAKFDSDTD